MEPTLIFETLHGSRAYGLARAGSDIDRKGIFVARPPAFLGYRPWPEQIEHSADYVHYDIRKFFLLAAACNPTVIELLFTEPEDHQVVTEEGKLLVEHRAWFLSKRARESFGRYGYSQLRRIRTHRKWLLSPPQKKPDRKDFGLPERTVISKDEMGAAEALMGRGTLGNGEVSESFLEVLDRERKYRGAQREWQQYQEWLKNRNPKRSELERQYGYDTKHAMHLVRLMRMAKEILETGHVRVRRPDASELLAVRDGAWDYDQLVQHAEELEQSLSVLVETTSLPQLPDEDRLDALCVEIVKRVLART